MQAVVGMVSAMAVAALLAPSPAARQISQPPGLASCAARATEAGGVRITWHAGPIDDAEKLDEWCRAVGGPVAVSTPPHEKIPPSLNEVTVLTWNAHLAEGRLPELIDGLRQGALTDGQPVHHFVLLVQELYRRGPEVPAFTAGMRAAFGIKARDPRAPDARDYARTLGLSMLYVPSMRNGADMLEDRGNAILSTEPLVDALALELPFERQRRVAVGGSITVSTAAGPMRLNVLNTHLEPLSAPSLLWVFRNPRRRQVAALLDLLRSPRFDNDAAVVGTVLGGDFNTIQGGAEEDAYVYAREWSVSLAEEDSRTTHQMGRLDYLFFQLDPDWLARTARVDEKFGSDHHPVVGRFFGNAELRH
jgi:endonuclease/exonuclease/phosphatase family metal-dependent hydrolase